MVLRCLQDADDAVLAQLPDRMNIRKQLQRERPKEMPLNPTFIEDLRAISDMLQTTKLVGGCDEVRYSSVARYRSSHKTVPLVYALMEEKETKAYAKVLEIIRDRGQ
ncbi:hypothetical protein TKK_0003660 [Trichogramma kaykai]|uniref:Uncharacterized protein n=1 Tax=Trichogramma kaykai TaxID=54128 RepID=A0ABD2XMZ6_9HYME